MACCSMEFLRRPAWCCAASSASPYARSHASLLPCIKLLTVGCPAQVPLPLYFMTHAYFCFYHALANVVLRRVRRAMADARPALAAAAFATAVFALAYVTAFMETATIAHFPYYTFKARPCCTHQLHNTHAMHLKSCLSSHVCKDCILYFKSCLPMRAFQAHLGHLHWTLAMQLHERAGPRAHVYARLAVLRDLLLCVVPGLSGHG